MMKSKKKTRPSKYWTRQRWLDYYTETTGRGIRREEFLKTAKK